MRYQISLIASFLEKVAEAHRPGAIYRGHANRSWDIKPAAFRRDPAVGIVSDVELESWKKTAARFAQRPMSDLEWLVLAQHYGVPTSLLDWTTNPLIALYFACQTSVDPQSSMLHDGAVYMISADELPDAPKNSNWKPFEADGVRPLVVDTLVMNKRTLAQDSIMTLHSKEKGKWVRESLPEIYRVEWANKIATLQSLKSMGISSDRIFVDLNVTAREFAEELSAQAMWNYAKATWPAEVQTS